MERKTIAEQISEFIKEHAEEVNSENFSVIEFIIQKARLDGMRVKKYIKAPKEKE